MARPINKTPLEDHPAINPSYQIVRRYGRNAYCAEITCPHCKEKRWFPLSTLRAQMKIRDFNGQCLKCSKQNGYEIQYKYFRRSGKAYRKVDNLGYVKIGPTAIKDEYLPLFRQIQRANSHVYEHRMVMTIALGRPLESYEWVDHMDGNKQNNAIENLRIYLKGKNEPGSGNGYGTYYHEWQMAEARIRELEARLKGVEESV